MDQELSKLFAQAAGIPSPDAVIFETAQTSDEVDRLTKALASLQTAHDELQARTARAEEQSITTLVTQMLADKLPMLIEAEIAKQFSDFYNSEIERQVEASISDYLASATVDCEQGVENAIEDSLADVRISFGRK